MDRDLLEAAQEVVLDILASATPDAAGLPDDDAWARAQQVLDWLEQQSAPAQATLSLEDAIAELDATFASRQIGERWQGKSGRWFTRNAQGHVVPYAAPQGSHAEHRFPRPRPAPEPEKTVTPEEAAAHEAAQQAQQGTLRPEEAADQEGTPGRPQQPADPAMATVGHKAMSSPEARQQAKVSLAETKASHLERTNEKSGLNISYFVALADGNRGIFKPAAGETQTGAEATLANIAPGTQWRREVAAADVAELISMADLVPPTVARTEGKSQGSMQQMVGGTREAADVSVEQRFNGDEDLARAAAFDYLTGQLDRHQGNWLLTQAGKLVLIDNGTSFPRKYDERGFHHVQFRLQAAQRNLRVPDMRSLEDAWAEIEAALARAGIEPDAIALTQVRMKQLAAASGKAFSELPLLARERGLYSDERTKRARPAPG